LWWYIKPILLALDQPVEVCDKATRYARFLTLGLVPYFGFEALRRFLQAQGIAKPMLIVSIIASVCHPIVNYIFIYRFALGYDGAPLAVITSQWVMFLSLLLYTVIRRPHTPETWGGFDREALTELGTYLKLAIPGGTCDVFHLALIAVDVEYSFVVLLAAAMLLAEWWVSMRVLNVCSLSVAV
jgi:multidrug resistance protein, MATE family